MPRSLEREERVRLDEIYHEARSVLTSLFDCDIREVNGASAMKIRVVEGKMEFGFANGGGKHGWRKTYLTPTASYVHDAPFCTAVSASGHLHFKFIFCDTDSF